MEEYTVKIHSDKTEWFQNGKRHRLDGPAVEHANGYKLWYQDDKRHRLDGPAAEHADGTKFWFQKGKLHRTDGPASEWADGDKFWYLNGKEVSEEEVMSPSPTCEGQVVEIDGVKYQLKKVQKPP